MPFLMRCAVLENGLWTSTIWKKQIFVSGEILKILLSEGKNILMGYNNVGCVTGKKYYLTHGIHVFFICVFVFPCVQPSDFTETILIFFWIKLNFASAIACSFQCIAIWTLTRLSGQLLSWMPNVTNSLDSLSLCSVCVRLFWPLQIMSHFIPQSCC